MAKKFGKFLLFTAAVGGAVAAYYYLQKKDSVNFVPEDDDYDDFSEDTDTTDDSSRNYVSLTPETTDPLKEEDEKEDSFVPLSETAAKVNAEVEESVEEFFDEEDSADEEPPITDN